MGRRPRRPPSPGERPQDGSRQRRLPPDTPVSMGWWDRLRRPREAGSRTPPDERHVVAAPSLDAGGWYSLADGGSVSVSNEDRYQDALGPLLPAGLREKRTEVELRMADGGNPWSRTVKSPVIEVILSGSTVGFLTTKMTDRYAPLLAEAARDGRALRSAALLTHSDKNGTRYVQVELSAVPRFAHQNSISGLSVETSAEHVVYRPTGTFHRIAAQETDASVRTHCGHRFPPGQVDVVHRTVPWVGRVFADGLVVDEDKYLRCSVCGGPGRSGSPRPDSARNASRRDAAGTVDALALLGERLDFDVAGESFRDGYPDNLLRLRQVEEESTGSGESIACVLIRDPKNEHDSNAIEVHVPGEAGHVGYVPADLAARLAPLLDDGMQLHAWTIRVRVHPDAPDRPGLTVGVKLVDTGDA